VTDSPIPPPERRSGGRRASDHDKKEDEGWIPRPPKSNSATDFIVIIFSITVATILVILTIGTIIAGILGADIKSYFAILTSIITSMISALVGYLAGKGQGRAEAEEKQQQ
jgi:hypothetical protein